MRPQVVMLMLFLISDLSADKAGAQGDPGLTAAPGNEFSLELKNSTTHTVVSLIVGETLRYQYRPSKHFVAGRITGITDSTISVESKENGKETIGLKDLTALRIPKSARKKAIGHILIVTGAWILVGVTVNPAEGTTTFLNYLAYPVGLFAVIKGYTIKHERKIDLDDSWSWSLKEIKVIDTIERGSFISIVMKNGEVIDEMKVDKVDQVQIKGFEITQDLNEQFVYTFRTIGVSDIETLIVKRR